MQGTIESVFLSLNGVFYFNEIVKEDRRAVSEKMVEHLKSGGNLMYFVEGTWNLSPNLPVLPCYWGIVDIATRGGAVVVPIAVEQYGKKFKIAVGESIDMTSYEEGVENKTLAIMDFRDTLATLKWQIWETEPMLNRSKLSGKEWDKYIEESLKEWPLDKDYITSRVYKPKGVLDCKEVYAFFGKLIPNKNNAFLFNKRLDN